MVSALIVSQKRACVHGNPMCKAKPRTAVEPLHEQCLYYTLLLCNIPLVLAAMSCWSNGWLIWAVIDLENSLTIEPLTKYFILSHQYLLHLRFEFCNTEQSSARKSISILRPLATGLFIQITVLIDEHKF